MRRLQKSEKLRLLFFCGWICPVCGTVNSPLIVRCPCNGVFPSDLEDPYSEEQQQEDDDEDEDTLPEQLAEHLWVDEKGELWEG